MTALLRPSLWVALAFCLPSVAFGQQAPGAAGAAEQPACTLRGKVYVCSKAKLQEALAAAHTVALVSQPANHASDAALLSLAKSLGKSVVAGTEVEPADLTFRLTPLEPAGVSVGMGTADLATLNVFVPTPGNPTAKLLWSETYSGSPDMPWASVARALVLQFEGRLGAR